MDHDLDVTPFLSSNSMAHNYEPVGLRFKLTEHSAPYECCTYVDFECTVCPSCVTSWVSMLHIW